MEVKVEYTKSLKMRRNNLFKGLNTKINEAITVELETKKLLPEIFFKHDGTANIDTTYCREKTNIKKIFIGKEKTILIKNKEKPKMEEKNVYHTVHGNFFSDNKKEWDEEPTEETLIKLYEKETDISESEELEKIKKELNKKNEKTEEEYAIAIENFENLKKKESDEMNRRAEAFIQKYGSKRLKKLRKKGYEYSLVLEDEAVEKTKEFIKDFAFSETDFAFSETMGWYSYENDTKKCKTPSLEQMQLTEKIENIFKDKNIDTVLTELVARKINIFPSIWDKGDNETTIEAQGVEVQILGRKFFIEIEDE